MSSLKMHDKLIFEKLFDNNGYVLNFNNQKFAEFFREHNINIEDNKYYKNGPSKMKRLRAFWEIEPDKIVGQVLYNLLQYACKVSKISSDDKKKAQIVISRLQGVNQQNISEQEAFLKKEFQDISIHNLNLNHAISEVIVLRMEEIKKGLESDAPLSVIFLCGSTLEGILLGVAETNSSEFNQTTKSPKDSAGKVLKFHEWTLNHLIDTAKELGFLKEDVKKFSHVLRGFRNYIHPYLQVASGFNPDHETARICFQVLKAAIHQINRRNR